MISKPDKVGILEVRFIGDCPWCGKRAVPIRDYLCYHATDICCHSMYRKLKTKVFIAIREFPYRKVNVETQFDPLVKKFQECIVNDHRFIKENDAFLQPIQKHLSEHNAGFSDFLKFLIRLYAIRGDINLLTENDFIKLQCIACGRNFSDTWKHEICSTCVETMGQPSESFRNMEPAPQAAPKKQRGMHFKIK